MYKKILFAFLLLALPSIGLAAPSFEILQCQNTVCQTTSSLSVAPFSSQTVTFRISIKNPNQEKIYSVQSWLQYNPQIWEVVSLSDENSDFELAAPGEFKAKSDTGEIRIGRAVAGTPITAPNAIVADITLKSKKDPTLSRFSWIDFLATDIGKTAIVGLNGNKPINLLSEKPKDIVFHSNTKNAGSTPNAYTTGSALKPNAESRNSNNTANKVQHQGKTETQLQNPTMNFININRPEGLRSRTHTDGSVDHLWQMGKDSRIAGYFIYYSTSSGIYMHRRDVGKTNAITFPAGFFEKGKRVYFAVQAYSSQKEVSDFSDETYLVVGTVGSESHPFFEQIFPNSVKVAQDDTNIYYQEANASGNLSANTTGKNALPSKTTQSGIDIPPAVLLILGGVALIFSRQMLATHMNNE